MNNVSAQYTPRFDLQGHRGARGLKPENTIPSFIAALSYGVTTLEMDVVISKDKKVVVSHEPWMSFEICTQPDGSGIERQDEAKWNIYQLTYDEIKQFDCGLKPVTRFPEQEKIKASKPLLSDVIIAVEDHIKSYSKYEVDYNIEIKSRKEGDGIFHPSPQEFSDIVYQLIDQYLSWERVVIQSFDMRVLKYWNTRYPHVRLAFLVENNKLPQRNLQDLGFTPAIYSPYFKLLTKEHVDYLHSLTATVKNNQAGGQTNGNVLLKMRVIPWTVNEVEDMKKMRNLGVDGLITDYPNRAFDLGLGLKPAANGKTGSKK